MIHFLIPIILILSVFDIKRLCTIRANNLNLYFLSELHEKASSKETNVALYMHSKDLLRIRLLEKNKNRFEVYEKDYTLKDFVSFVDSYNSFGKITLLDFTLNSSVESAPFFSHNDKAKEIVSFFSQNNKKKRHHVIEIKVPPPYAVQIISADEEKVTE